MLDLLIDGLITLLALLAIYGIGRAVRRLVPLTFWSRSTDLAYSLGFGLGTLTTLLFLLSLVGLLRPLFGWGILIIGVSLAIWQRDRLGDDLQSAGELIRAAGQASWIVKLFYLLGLAFALMNFLADLAPPVEGDTVHQYLLTSRYWVEAGRYVQPAHVWASTLPGNMMMLSAWALLLRNSYSLATLITGFGMSTFLAVGVYSLARLYVDRAPALIASVALYTMPDAGYLAQSAKVDMGWAFFEALALAAFLYWIDHSGKNRTTQAKPSPEPEHWLILAGVCLGLAAGSKNQTLISIVLLGLWVVLHLSLQRDLAGLRRAGLSFGLAVLIATLPYYLYNGIAHRNPFYPVFAHQLEAWIGATPSPRSELGTEVFYPWTIVGYLTNLWNASLGHPAGFYLGFIAGPIFLITLPAGWLLGAMKGQKKLARLLIYVLVFSVIWFLVKQAVRHFLPGLILLAVVTGFILWQLDQRKTTASQVVLAMALLAVTGNLVSELGVIYANGSYRVTLGIDSRESYIQRWHDEVIPDGYPIPDWETITVLNDLLEPSDRVLAAHAASLLYFEPQIVSGVWGDRLQYDAITSPDGLLDALAEHDIQYILTYKIDPPGELIYTDPAFLAAHGELLYDGKRTQLYRITTSGSGKE